MRLWSRAGLLLSAPGWLLAAAAVALVLESPGPQRVLAALLASVGPLLAWSVGVAARLRYPERPLGSLLFLLAAGLTTQVLVASADPYLFTLGRVARPAVEVLLVWVMLAFPSGRLSGRRERALVVATALAVLLLWLPSVMFSENVPLPGVFVQCHPDCPRNVLLIADRPDLSTALLSAFRVVGVAVLVATGIVLFRRLQQATPLLRRALAPVLVVSIARTVAIALLLTLGQGRAGYAYPLTLWAVPLAIALGLVRGRLYTARTLQRLVHGLRGRPDVHALREVLAKALGDPSLSIAFWLKETNRWVDPDGNAVAIPHPSALQGRIATVLLDAGGNPSAALVHDVALLEEPMLLDAVTSSMQLALESHRLDLEISASTLREASAVVAERHRIERDLHDGAQQRVIALRMKLSVTARLLLDDPRRAAQLVAELDGDVDALLVELRGLAQGLVPPLLLEQGLGAALREAAHRAAIRTRVEIDDVGRCDPAVELAVYFCCLEALQNAAKHAGPGATARLMLRRHADSLEFSVTDDGLGMAATAGAAGGQGFVNMRERIEGVGGRLEIKNLPGKGVCVAGEVVARGASMQGRPAQMSL
jgi:signal transduction histidine kinase